MAPEGPRETIVAVPGSLRAGRHDPGAGRRAEEPGSRRVVQSAGAGLEWSQAKGPATLPVASGSERGVPRLAIATAARTAKTTNTTVAMRARRVVTVRFTQRVPHGFSHPTGNVTTVTAAGSDDPGVAVAEQFVDVGEGGVGVRGLQLGLALGAVDGPDDVAEDADRGRAGRALGEAGEGGGVARVLDLGVMDDEAALARLGDVDDFEAAAARGDDALLEVGAEADRLAVLEADLVGRAPLATDGVEGAVVEDVAVLVDLDEGRAGVLGGGPQGVADVLLLDVDRAGDEGGVGAERQGERVERVVLGPERRRLGDLAGLRGGRVLALGQPVDLVVEEQQLDRDVAAQGVDQVVALDRKSVV